jgi:peptide/nickel transport system substrate-binding protein
LSPLFPRLSAFLFALATVLFWASLMPSGPAQTETVLRVARNAAPPSLGNPLTSVGQPGSGVWSVLYDSLTVIGPGGVIAPALATSWELVNDTRWVFHLRPDVTFHNGAPLTAAAVAAILEYLKSPAGRRFYVATEVDTIAAIEIIDDLTLALETTVPDAILPKRMALIAVPEPNAWQTLGPDGFAQTPLGTGSFMLRDWGQASGKMVFDAYTESWRAPKEIDVLELWTVADATTRVQALLTGQVDVLEAISLDDIGLVDAAGFKVWTFGGAQVASIAFRTVGNPESPLQDARVRQALNYAVNRSLIAEVLFGGSAAPASQGASMGTFGYDPTLEPIPYDPERAKSLLAEAGYTNGFDLTIEVLTGFSSVDTLLYQQVAQDLRMIGIEVTVRTPPFASWLRKFQSNDWGDTDAFSLMWDSGAYADAIRPVRNFSCAKAVPFFCDETIMPLIEQTDRIMNVEDRERHLQQLMRKMRDLAPALLLTTATQRVAASPRVQTLTLNPPNIAYHTITFN